MSNSIRHPRQRPRVDSTSARSLYWVIAREAFLRMVLTPLTTADEELAWRVRLCKWDTWKVVAEGQRIIASWPARRFRP